jgi:stage II sporulation protein D
MRSTYHRLGACLLALATIAGLLLDSGRALGAPASAGPELVIAGAGDGHGVGMSQEGALGYAEHGWSYQQILAHYYTGTAIAQAPEGARVRVLINGQVHSIALETYVRGVVAAEMPANWPLAALEAQAVASRTYALTDHAGGSKFDVYSDTRSQVYRGVAAETPQSDAAIGDTAGQIVTYEGQPAITYFFASSGGMTENVENAFPGAEPKPWLRGVADPYDGGPLHGWKLSMSFAVASRRLKGLVKGAFRGIEVTGRGVSPRIVAAEVLGSGGVTKLRGPELEARLGLYSTWAYFSVRTGQAVTPEPDTSGQPAFTTPAASSPPVVAAPSGAASLAPSGSLGGVQAGGEPEASAASYIGEDGGTVGPEQAP